MKIYLVGGAVRDELLGLPVKERDYVVVGATVEQMLNLGYQQVGKEFPVFLHPVTREEYALARMERKTSPGYTGFSFDTSPDVTLEADLIRRDLTINAMAFDIDKGNKILIDPYHGKNDLLNNKILRHVSLAFAEDPVRILRVGRFLARYAHRGFTVAPETITLMRDMVAAGEVNALVAERVWKELERALGEQNPDKFFDVLETCGAMPILFPDLTARDMPALMAASTLSPDTAIRFAALLHRLPEQSIKLLCDRYRAPNAYRELALLTARHFKTAHQAHTSNAADLLAHFQALDIFRRETRFKHFLIICQAIAQSENLPFHMEWLLQCANAAKSYDVQELIKQGLQDNALAEALKEKRRERIAEWLENGSPPSRG